MATAMNNSPIAKLKRMPMAVMRRMGWVSRRPQYHALAHPVDHHLQQKLHLVGLGDPGHGRLVEAAQHDVVRQVDRVHDQVLKGDEEDQRKELPVKLPVPGQQTHQASFPSANCAHIKIKI